MNNLFFIAAVLAFALVAGCVQQQETTTTIVACTMDAKACPDGSYVGRVPPNCEFAQCPAVTTTTLNGNLEEARTILEEDDGLNESIDDLGALEE